MKITAEHLARGAYVYVRQSTADQLVNNPESRRRQYALPSERGPLAGKTPSSSMKISVVQGLASAVRALRSFWRRSAKVGLMRSSPLRPPGWPAMAGTGIRSSNFAALSERSSSMRTASTNRVIPTTGCCSA